VIGYNITTSLQQVHNKSKSNLHFFDLLWICCKTVKVIKVIKQIHNRSYKWSLDLMQRFSEQLIG